MRLKAGFAMCFLVFKVCLFNHKVGEFAWYLAKYGRKKVGAKPTFQIPNLSYKTLRAVHIQGARSAATGMYVLSMRIASSAQHSRWIAQ
jgi:hypothetical protein